MHKRTVIALLIGILGIFLGAFPDLFSANFYSFLGGIIFILAVFLLIDIFDKNYTGGNNSKTDIHTESLGFVAHQLRSPLTAIKGYADLVIDGTFGEASPQIKDAAIKMRAATERAFKTIDELLDFNALESGAMTLKSEPVSLNSFLNKKLESFKPIASLKNLKLTFAPSENEIVVNFDPSHLDHVIDNVLDNAVKYTDKGSIEMRVKANPEFKSVILEVSDTGKGISNEILETIFKPFERDSRHAHDVKGMGLGLTIAKKLLKLNHSKIWVKSDGFDKGSVFYIQIPIKES